MNYIELRRAAAYRGVRHIQGAKLMVHCNRSSPSVMDQYHFVSSEQASPEQSDRWQTEQRRSKQCSDQGCVRPYKTGGTEGECRDL